MPIFEFACDKCNKVSEKLMSFSDSEKYNEKCDCGNGKLTKVPVNSFNLNFKGKWFKNTRSY